MNAYIGHDVRAVDQLVVSDRPDIVPRGGAARSSMARVLSFDAVVYGLPAVYQYAQLCEQHLATGLPYGSFRHERELARPGFGAFRVPNVDTLYSQTWLDLRDGPVQLEIPEFGSRYFTLNFFDGFSNASNINARTAPGTERFLIVPPGWEGEPPDDPRAFHVASPVMWVLMRIQTRGDVETVLSLQDAVRFELPPDRPAESIGGAAAVVTPEAVESDWVSFFRALDSALRLHGYPAEEEILVRRFGSLGLGADARFDPDALDLETRQGMAQGYRDAMAVVDASRPQLGQSEPTGWTRVLDKGRHGFNYLARAVMNHVGLGANVTDENTSFNTYVDADGRRLDGGTASYRLRLDRPPPNDAFWSVTLYDAEGLLVPNIIDRSCIGSATPEIEVADDGSVTIDVAADDPRQPSRNWLPCPRGEFFLVLRIYAPGEEVVAGTWLPGPVEPRMTRSARENENPR